MDRPRVPAKSARRRTSIGLTVALVTCVAFPVLAGYLQPDGGGLTDLGIILILTATLILFVLPFLDQGGWYRLHDERYLTAWTVSGWRTVDLHRLARIRRFRSITEGRSRVDMLVLTDVDGARLMLDKDEVDRAVQRALADHPNDAVDISRAVRHRFGTFEPPRKLRLWWLLQRIGYPLVLFPLSLGASVVLAVAAHSVLS